ncbi:hypothetical protein RUM43_008641 [Polyplax serrata]|uniref:Uncharacterized protein n=1 Tax=Polyplax serrata TaxID=468196 RepID=A0AAN8P9L9_POLSC
MAGRDANELRDYCDGRYKGKHKIQMEVKKKGVEEGKHEKLMLQSVIIWKDNTKERQTQR